MYQICLFEDKLRSQFYPFYLTRPIDLIRIGILTIQEKWSTAFKNSEFRRITHPILQVAYYDLDMPENRETLFINSRYLPSEDILHQIKALQFDIKLVDNSGHIIAYKSKTNKPQPPEKSQTVNARSISWPWDIFSLNEEEINRDFDALKLLDNRNEIHRSPGVIIDGDYPVYIDPSATIEPNVTIMSDQGPVYIGREVKLLANSVIKGAVSINEHTIVKVGAVIYGASSIGPHSRIGGEVKNVVFFGNSNKGHSGFLGDSVVGAWVNLGADTNGSNLKNNYSNIRVDLGVPGIIDTGLQFCGQFIGDHTKTSINTMMNTGSVYGVASNIATSGFPPKRVESFTWLTAESISGYDVNKAIDTVFKVLDRRGITPSNAYLNILRAIHESEEKLL